MIISFRLDRCDFSALQKIAQERINRTAKTNSRMLLFNVAAWIPMGMFFTGMSQLFRDNPHLWVDLGLTTGALAIGIAAVVASNRYWRKRVMVSLLADDSWFLKDQEIHICKDGILQRAAFGEAIFKWNSFHAVEEDDERLFLFLDNAQGLIIPKSAVQSQEELRELTLRVAR